MLQSDWPIFVIDNKSTDNAVCVNMSCTKRIISFDFDIVVEKNKSKVIWRGLYTYWQWYLLLQWSNVVVESTKKKKKKKILLSLRVQIKLNHSWFIKFYQGIPLWVNNSVIKESALVITADEYIGKVFSNSAIETTWQSKKR